MGYKKYVEGHLFGNIIFLEDVPTQDRRRSKFRCFCGKEFISHMYQVIRGNTASCGCLRSSCQIKHGHASTKTSPTYNSWHSMKDRCLNPKSRGYKYWGGKGVRICDRWLEDNGFENFLEDMGERPSINHTLDRYPDNTGHYEPGNTRWASKKEQARNQISNRIIEFNGKKQLLCEWAEQIGLRTSALGLRIEKMGLERALTVPLKKNKRRKLKPIET